MFRAIRTGIGREVLGIIGNSEVGLFRIQPNIHIVVDSLQGTLDACVVFGYVITAVYQIVAHDVDKVNIWPDLRSLLFRERNHVTL